MLSVHSHRKSQIPTHRWGSKGQQTAIIPIKTWTFDRKEMCMETDYFICLHICGDSIFFVTVVPRNYFLSFPFADMWSLRVQKMGNVYSCLVILCSDYPWINGTLPIKSKICNLSSFSRCYIEADSQLLKNIIVTVCLFSSVHANC